MAANKPIPKVFLDDAASCPLRVLDRGRLWHYVLRRQRRLKVALGELGGLLDTGN